LCAVVALEPALLQESMNWESYAKLLEYKFIFFLERIEGALSGHFSTSWKT
jgi:hypothetical protein